MKKMTISIIVILIVFLVFVAIAIIFIKKQESNDEAKVLEEIRQQYEGLVQNEETGEYESEDLLAVNSYEYMTVRNCIQNYIDIINFKSSNYYKYNGDTDEYIYDINEEEISKNAYDILSEDFISANNIKETEVFKYIDKMETSNLLTIVEMKELRKNERIKYYGVHIVLQNTTDLQVIQNYYIIVNIDKQNETYSIQPLNINSMDDIQLNTKIDKIEPNKNNKFQYAGLTDVDMIKECMNRYKRISLIYPEFVYNNILDKEYREKRFGSVEKFANYIQKNKEKIMSINLKKYQAGASNSQTQYVCIDQMGQYYIFRKNSIIDSSLILDTYTIDIPEFVEKYDIASETNKVGLNANKIVEAANNGDYEYIYNKLDETFRQNNFGSVDKLEEYIKNTFYENSVIKQAQCKQEGNAYICTLQISDYEGKSLLKEVKIIMKLLENRDFVMSFSI